jgi:FAD/FMN-containing dehydrogenase
METTVHRRSFFKATSGALLQLFASCLPAAVRARIKGRRRVRPSDAGWPSAAQWQKLGRDVEGNLIKPKPLFAPCQAEAGGAACADVMKNMRNPFFIGDQPSGTEVSGWVDAWTPAASEYAVAAKNAAHVASAVNFARKHNLRLVVKGTGHSYLGTSNAPDSLLIWTRAMNKVVVHEAFVPSGCKAPCAPVPAVSAGAGAMWIDLYDAVTTRGGRYVQGGGCTTTGVAGLVQSGGFGSFSKQFGTAAAGLLEAEIVTADGQIRIANPHRHPDLFWALKGGGGGSWGVVTRVTLRTHELPASFCYVDGEVKAHSEDAFRRLIAKLVDFYSESLFNPHWGEQIKIAPDNSIELSMDGSGLDVDQAKRVWQPFFDFVRSSKDLSGSDLEAGANMRPRHNWDVVDRESKGNHDLIRDPRPGAPSRHAFWEGDQDQVGALWHAFDSLWLPASLLQKDQRSRLAEALFAASRHRKLGLHFNKGIAGAPAEAVAATKNTATNPAVLDAFVLVIVAAGEKAAYPGMSRPPVDVAAARRRKLDVDRAAAELRKIAPGTGSYVSESNYFNESWREAYWGTNYPRLRAIKRKYDPDGLFIVHHGVGSEDWSKDGFERANA